MGEKPIPLSGYYPAVNPSNLKLHVIPDPVTPKYYAFVGNIRRDEHWAKRQTLGILTEKKQKTQIEFVDYPADFPVTGDGCL